MIMIMIMMMMIIIIIIIIIITIITIMIRYFSIKCFPSPFFLNGHQCLSHKSHFFAAEN